MLEIAKKYYAKSLTELAKVLGFTKPHILQLSKDPESPQKGENGYHVGAWVKFLVSRAKAQKKKDNPQNKANIEYRQECTKIKKLERKALEGILVNRKKFMREEMDRLTELRQTFMRLARKVSAKAAMKPAAEIIVVIDAEVRRIFRYFEDLYTRGHEIKKGRAKVGKPTKVEKSVEGQS